PGQLFAPSAKSAAFAPVIENVENTTGAFPEFAIPIVRGALALLVSWLPKSRLAGVKVRGCTAAPETLTTRGLPSWLSAIDSVAAREPAAAGAKVTPIVHLAPGATAPAQPLVAAKSAGLAPAMVVPVTVRLV